MGTYSLFDRTRGEDVWLESRKMVTASPENSETPLESIQGLGNAKLALFCPQPFPRSRDRLANLAAAR